MRQTVRSMTIALAVILFAAGIADAQWIYLGRKALGKVKQLTSEADELQTKTSGGTQPAKSGYDVATVLLEAPADKVYNAAVRILQSKPEVRISKKDDRAMTIDFTDGNLTGGMQVTSLSDTISQLLVASTSPGNPDTSVVLKGVLRVCKEMGVHCESSNEK